MKKIFALLVCTILLVCAFHLSVFAEGDSAVTATTAETVGDTSTPAEETATESEISGGTGMPDITTEMIVGYIEDHLEEISVICSLIISAFYTARKHRLLNRSISATNKNAITVAENSAAVMTDATTQMAAFSALFAKYQASEEEKKKLRQALDNTVAYIQASKLANIEFANELAELLVLANIPNSKKEELYSRHVAAVNAIAEAGKAEVSADETGNEA